MKWKIGNVTIKNQTVLAPMAGICDSAFRTIIKSMDCGLIGTEMVSDKAIMYDNYKSKDMLYMTDYERPISQQLFGSDLKSLTIASKYIYENMKPDILDINMGCPVEKVTKKAKAGSALLKNPEKVETIVKTIVETVPIPVTVKIRSGWDENHINAKEISEIIENAGASAITIHPRTKKQGYSGTADWNIIKEVKDTVSIPVIGNGDIKTCYDAKEMIKQTNCDAIMIGRRTIGNPWLIKECVDYLENGTEPREISIEEKIKMLKKHTSLLIQNTNEKMGILKIRRHAAHYINDLPNKIEVKEKIFQIKTKEELFNLLDENIN